MLKVHILARAGCREGYFSGLLRRAQRGKKKKRGKRKRKTGGKNGGKKRGRVERNKERKGSIFLAKSAVANINADLQRLNHNRTVVSCASSS